MYQINKTTATKIEPLTFSELNMTENDMEELLRNNIDMICDEEESMLIVGKQVRNASLARSDLTAVDNDGDIVLIEIKRDIKDSVQTYALSIHKESGKSLAQIREEYMEKIG